MDAENRSPRCNANLNQRCARTCGTCGRRYGPDACHAECSAFLCYQVPVQTVGRGCSGSSFSDDTRSPEAICLTSYTRVIL